MPPMLSGIKRLKRGIDVPSLTPATPSDLFQRHHAEHVLQGNARIGAILAVYT